MSQKFTRQVLRNLIREALEEGGDSMSNAELVKGLKTGAADIAADVPAKLNDELAKMIETLTAMAQYDQAGFRKMLGYAESLGAKALEKSKKGDPPEEQK